MPSNLPSVFNKFTKQRYDSTGPVFVLLFVSKHPHFPLFPGTFSILFTFFTTALIASSLHFSFHITEFITCGPTLCWILQAGYYMLLVPDTFSSFGPIMLTFVVSSSFGRF